MQITDAVRDMHGVLHAVVEVSGLETAIFSRIEDERWCAQAVLDGGQFGVRRGDVHDVREMLCGHVRDSGAPLAVANLAVDERFRSHATHLRFGAHAYVGVPVQFDDGAVVGTLCALSKRAIPDADRAVPLMSLLSQLVAHELQLVSQARNTEDRLVREQLTAEERERFLALVAHDLRNPLSAIRLHAELLAKQVPPGQRELTERILAIVARMVRLIDDLLDLSRGRVGSGISIRLRRVGPREFLTARLNEIRIANPHARVHVELGELPDVTDKWDPDRVAQLLDNVIGNAIQHGEKEPVIVRVKSDGGQCEIDILNDGAKIPDDVLATLFEPFHRSRAPGRGLGLGLYISHQIALAHGGDIEAETKEGHTCFRVTLPV